MMSHWWRKPACFDVDAETAHIHDPHTREMCRSILEFHNKIWHDL
jgi:hypothetical protein